MLYSTLLFVLTVNTPGLWHELYSCFARKALRRVEAIKLYMQLGSTYMICSLITFWVSNSNGLCTSVLICMPSLIGCFLLCLTLHPYQWMPDDPSWFLFHHDILYVAKLNKNIRLCVLFKRHVHFTLQYVWSLSSQV